MKDDALAMAVSTAPRTPPKTPPRTANCRPSLPSCRSPSAHGQGIQQAALEHDIARRIEKDGVLHSVPALDLHAPASTWALFCLRMPDRRGEWLVGRAVHHGAYGSVHPAFSLGSGTLSAVRLLSKTDAPLCREVSPQLGAAARAAAEPAINCAEAERALRAPGSRFLDCAFVDALDAGHANALRYEAKLFAVVTQDWSRGSLADWISWLSAGAFPLPRQPQPPPLASGQAGASSAWSAIHTRAQLGQTLALQVLRDVSGAMQWLSKQGMLHGAIVPRHLLWTPNGWTLTDFRHAALLGDNNDDALAFGRDGDEAAGGYWAPESFRSLAAPRGLSFDMWSLGCVAQQCLMRGDIAAMPWLIALPHQSGSAPLAQFRQADREGKREVLEDFVWFAQAQLRAEKSTGRAIKEREAMRQELDGVHAGLKQRDGDARATQAWEHFAGFFGCWFGRVGTFQTPYEFISRSLMSPLAEQRPSVARLDSKAREFCAAPEFAAQQQALTSFLNVFDAPSWVARRRAGSVPETASEAQWADAAVDRAQMASWLLREGASRRRARRRPTSGVFVSPTSPRSTASSPRLQ